MSWAPLNRLIVPAILLIAAFMLRERIFDLKPAYLQLPTILPYVIFGAVMAVAFFFNRTRPFATALGLAVAYWVIVARLQKSLSDPDVFATYTMLTLLLPLILIFLLLAGEKGLRSAGGLWVVVAVPALLSLILWSQDNQFVSAFISDHLSMLSRGRYNLSAVASVCYASCTLFAVFALFRQNSEHAASITMSSVFTFVVFAFYGLPKISTVMYAALGLGLVVSLLRSSHDIAYRDELTGLRSRRSLNERLNTLGRRFVIAMVDVDHFKNFNDSYGHAVGDDVLKMVARRLATIRGGTVYRYGGEEFCIVFPGSELEQCTPAVELIREKIADYKLYVRDVQKRPRSRKEGEQRRGLVQRGRVTSVTVSIGAAASGPRKIRPEEVLQAADAALYQAKKKGRNRLVCAEASV